MHGHRTLAVTHHIGLEIAEHSFRVTEMRATDGFPAVLRTSMHETRDDFAGPLLHAAATDAAVAARLSQELTDALRAGSMYATRISVVLATQLPLVAVLPSDPLLPLAEKRRQFAWECRALMALAPHEPLSVQSFLLSRSADAESWLVSALPQRTVMFLREIFELVGYDLCGIDIAHFSIENGIRALLRPLTQDAAAIAGLHPRRCDVGMDTGGTYIAFRSSALTGQAPLLKQVLASVHALLDERLDTRLSSLTLHGPLAGADLAIHLQELLGIPVTHFDARNHVSFLAGSDADAARSRPAASMDASICAALKGIRTVQPA